jgi:hypothetical protein
MLAHAFPLPSPYASFPKNVSANLCLNIKKKSLRNASLLDLHKTANTNVSNSKTRSEKETDKKQKVVWDHDAMMGVNSKLLSDNQKANMINDAKGLGGRFGGGSFL